MTLSLPVPVESDPLALAQAEYHHTYLLLPTDLPYDTWAPIGQTLGDIDRAVPWYIGDWLRYGERTYGETYVQAASETGYSPNYLANLLWVCNKIPPDRRRHHPLSFGHHQVVAALDEAGQEYWLDMAETQGLSVKDLRAAIKAATFQEEEEDEGLSPDWVIAVRLLVEAVKIWNEKEIRRLTDLLEVYADDAT